MRWHPLIIKWCISLSAKSPTAYRQINNSGLLYLLSVSTLKSYLNWTDSFPDINPDVLDLLVRELDIPNMQEHEKNACLVWDEIKVKSGLVMSKGLGNLDSAVLTILIKSWRTCPILLRMKKLPSKNLSSQHIVLLSW